MDLLLPTVFFFPGKNYLQSYRYKNLEEDYSGTSI